MQRLHGNARLTRHQRREIQERFRQGIARSELAKEYGVSWQTVNRWCHRDTTADQTGGGRPPNPPASFAEAALRLRKEHPEYGALRIAQFLCREYPDATEGKIDYLLRKAGLIGPRPAPPKRRRKSIPVGRHRIQLDIQRRREWAERPTVAGGQGFEYQISLIHLKTRWKYSEIHPDSKSATVVKVLEAALAKMPPFFLSGLDGQRVAVHDGADSAPQTEDGV